MNIKYRVRLSALVISGLVSALTPAPLRADVAPPVEIKMALPVQTAVTGQEYSGVFEVRIFASGTLDDFELYGAGWKIVSAEMPNGVLDAEPGVLRIPFRAVPANADAPIGLTLTYDGRRVRQAYEIGPGQVARAGLSKQSMRRNGSTGLRPGVAMPDGHAASRGGSDEIQVVGRIVYTRPCRDMSRPADGDCNDPEDIPERTVGVDRIDVRIWDSDTIGHEEMWSGYTDHDGYFDTGIFNWGGSLGDPDPDLVLYYETDTVDVDVTDNSVWESTFEFESAEVTDYTGSFYDFGWHSPAASFHPALHIFNSIVRTERFIKTRTPYDPPKVQVEWPDDSQNGGAWYESGPKEIHLSTQRQWRTDTHAHEFGHHFMSSFMITISPDYCNGICDGGWQDVCAAGPDPCESGGHCMWCEETDHDAWNEGWPNWLADVVTRSYPLDYQHDDGSDFVPLYTRSMETVMGCGCDGGGTDGFLIEGVVGALLTDIEDDKQDNADADDFRDMLCLGVDEIFDVTVSLNTTNIAAFINGFIALYPEHTDGLYHTAKNVSAAFGNNFPADTQRIGVVQTLDSPTHPKGQGGALPCIVAAWEPPDDDVNGVCDYSLRWSTNSSPLEPDDIEESIGAWDCLLARQQLFDSVGQYYVNIKAAECGFAFSDDWATFGPFEITDCNNSGLVDLCDISCFHDGTDTCEVPNGMCNVTDCGLSADCNDNAKPDECDIADGTSEDCNENGIPDECENMAHWDGGSGSWDDASRWVENITPPNGFDVCIDDPDGEVTVTISQDVASIGILACEDSLAIVSSGFPGPDLTLNEPSWIKDNLTLRGSASHLWVNDRLDIDGLFSWTGSNNSNVAHLGGPGTTYAHGGLLLDSIVPLDSHHLVLDNNSTSVSTGRIGCGAGSLVEIKPGSTYDHQGSTALFSQCWTSELRNEGTLIKSVDTGLRWLDVPLISSGLIHVKAGTLNIPRQATISGDIIADPGTTIQFMGGQKELTATSSLTAERVRFESHIAGSNFIRGSYNATISTVQAGQPLTFTEEANIINYGPTFSIPSGSVDFNAIIDDTIHFDSLSLGSGRKSGTARFNSGDPVVIETLTLGPGHISGPSEITVNGLLTWGASSSFTGPGVVNANGGLVVGTGGGQKSMVHRVMNNAGTATLLGGFGMNYDDSMFNNLPGAVMDIQVDSGGSVVGGAALNNAGTLVKTAGPGTSTISSHVTNTGIVEIQTGVLEFYTDYGYFYVQTAGQTILNGGDLSMFGPAPVQINGGVLTGQGTITGNVNINGGTVAPGLSAGTLVIDGNYSQSTESALEIELEGTNEGEFDRLEVSGTATLAGELQIVEGGSYTPSLGDVFVIITATLVTGEFETVTGPSYYKVKYEDQSVMLVNPSPADIDLTGNVDLHDWSLVQRCFGGSDVPPAADCPAEIDADLDNDGDVDLDDASIFLADGLTGPE